MKKNHIVVNIIIIILTVCVLAGCSTKNYTPEADGGSVSSVIDINEVPVDGNISSSEPVLKEPPVLSAYIEDSPEAIYQMTLGSYYWMYKAENGAMTGAIADAPHPLQMSNPAEIPVDSDGTVLVLVSECENISVTYWPDGADVEDAAEAVTLSGLCFEISKGQVYSIFLRFADEQFAEYVFKTV